MASIEAMAVSSERGEPAGANEIAPHITAWVKAAIKDAPAGHIPLLFLSGPQGAGKSTALHQAITALPMPVAGASIDDFYLPKPEREILARKISPLFITRGPPGTHDLSLLSQTTDALRAAGPTTSTPIPAFDKLADDRAPTDSWRSFAGRPAAIVVEGWLMGALADPLAPAAPALNAVEAEDVSGDWRRYQEHALAGAYRDLWDQADGFLHILPPGFDCVLGWRIQQEAELWQRRHQEMPSDRQAWVERFIAHYERITRRMIAGGHRAGKELRIDAHRQVTDANS